MKLPTCRGYHRPAGTPCRRAWGTPRSSECSLRCWRPGAQRQHVHLRQQVHIGDRAHDFLPVKQQRLKALPERLFACYVPIDELPSASTPGKGGWQKESSALNCVGEDNDDEAVRCKGGRRAEHGVDVALVWQWEE